MSPHHTYPKVVFGDTTFSNLDILEASVIEEFDPICATLRAGRLELTIYSTEANFSALNPYRTEAFLDSKEPLYVYEVVGGVEYPIGLYYLDEWETAEDTLIKFRCIDQIGLLDTYNYNGGIWLTPITVQSLINQITEISGVDFVVDPDISTTTVKGWIPICSCREALQQILFAAGAYAISARQEGFIRIGQLISTYGAVSRGLVCGVGATGQSRNWQRSWRPAQFAALELLQEISEEEISASRPVVQKIGVTGVEVVSHNYTQDTTNVQDLFNDTLEVGLHRINFSAPAHTLNVTGATEIESGANYIIISVSAEGLVSITGKPYIDSIIVYSQYLPEYMMGNKKENIIKVESAYLVNISNGVDVTTRVYNYHQLRFIQKCKLYSPIYIQAGSEVFIDTLYTQQLRGWVEHARMDLARGFLVDIEICGDLQIPTYELYSGLFTTGESRTRQRSFRAALPMQ